jgi:peptidoglycan-associated lipoprotein
MRIGTDKIVIGFIISLSSVVFIVSCQPMDPPSVAKHKIDKRVVEEISRSSTAPVSDVRLSPVHFETGSDLLSNVEDPVLVSNVLWLNKNPKAVLVLEGHCDERGGDRLNMQLGDRRARRVKSDMIAQGIDSDRLIMVVSYGARKPLDPRHTPDAWNVNRRVEFIVR